MKTIHQIELINWVKKDPVAVIGQRSYKVLWAFLLPFDFFCEPEISEKDLRVLEKYPSIEEEIENTFKVKLGTNHWTSILKNESEDDRALFFKVVECILTYDDKYANPEKVRYSLRIKKGVTNLNLEILLGAIGFRPEMYFGTSELSCLRAYIDGYMLMKETFELAFSPFEEQLFEFIKRYKIEDNLGHKTWDRNYRYEWDFAMYDSNERSAIPRFLKDIEDFTKTELTFVVNDETVKVDWSDYKSWNKSLDELLHEKRNES